MSSQETPDETFVIEQSARRVALQPASLLKLVLKIASSLKLTVALFGFSIFLVMAGTLAQVELDIWDVVRHYFRCWFAWVPVRVFHPLFAPYLDLSGVSTKVGMWFPGGYLIGTLMATNLLAAHSLKFKLQAKGSRLTSGLVVTAIGMVVTWLVIESGHGSNSIESAIIGWDTLWSLLKGLAACLLLTTAWSIIGKWKENRGEALTLCVVFAGLTIATYFLFNRRQDLIDDSGMRILWQLVKACGGAVILLTGCILLFRKRGGVVLLHAGVGLMMINEVVVDTAHIETQMRISEGESVNYSDDIREFELVFVNRSRDAAGNEEIVIPKWMIMQAGAPGPREDNRLSDDQMPFDVEIVKFMQNSNAIQPRDLRIDLAMTLGVPPFQVSGTAKIVDLATDPSKVDDLFKELAKVLGTKSVSANLRARLETLDDVHDYVFKESNPATAGPGKSLVFSKVRPGAGTDSGGAVDLTAAYVRILDKNTGQELATFLTGVFFELVRRDAWGPNRIEIDGETWDASLRFKRYYKSYSVHLKDVSKTDYVGTNTPRDYRSVVQIVDVNAGDDFEKHIWMNNPLRYSGETFYQSNYGKPDPVTGKESTTLAVVSNTGWLIPYVACMIVATGMLAHFWIVLVRFLRRRDAKANADLAVIALAATGNFLGAALFLVVGRFLMPRNSEANEQLAEPPQQSWIACAIPWIVVLLVIGWLGSKTRMPSYESTEANLHEFGKLPLVYEGRIKPFDTLARNSLRILSNRETFKDENGDAQPAILWLLDVIANPEVAQDHRVFRIDHPQLLKKLKLDRRKKHLYSLSEFMDEIPVLVADANAARKKDANDRNADERELIDLQNKVGQLDLLVAAFTPPDVAGDFEGYLDRFDKRQPPLAIPPMEGEEEPDFTFIPNLSMRRVIESRLETFLSPNEDWKTFGRGWTRTYFKATYLETELSKPVQFLSKIMYAHAKDDAEVFNDNVQDYHRWLERNRPADFDSARTGFETFFNQFSPFYYSAFSYLFAFIFAVIGLLGWSRSMNRTAFLIILATFCFHTFALVARIYISGRPPVTNLYSSAVFIGWGCVVLGMVFECIYRLGIGNVIGAALGAITLGISHLLAGDGDTFKVLQAVLDTQFWLATHVVCITLGYSTTFLAGALGLYYVLAGLMTDNVTPGTSKELSRMIYGTICFGIFFSFVGTVLGGLWADDSWGRFWGWDPKENGALLIVLWNAILLHAHWDKMVGPRGLAVLAIGGNVITSWSWFGVNELSVGLHAYGFTEGVWATLWAFWLSQFVIMGVGMLPGKYWRSEGIRSSAAASTKTARKEPSDSGTPSE